MIGFSWKGVRSESERVGLDVIFAASSSSVTATRFKKPAERVVLAK